VSQSTIDRRKRIMAQLLDKKQVSVRDLAGSLEVSDATVRRDLKVLADEQGLELNHGGASLPRDRDYSYEAKLLRASEAKRVIGELAASLVHDGDHIFLDSGTTCSEVVPHLKRLHNITILANSARLAFDLDGSSIRMFLIGGEYRPDRMDTVGPMSLTALNTVRGYVAFIGADGVSMEFGPSASDVESAHLNHQVIQNASSTVLLVDHSKLGNASLFQIVDWSQIRTVVTDQQPSDEWVDFLQGQSIDLIYPKNTDPSTSS